MDLDVACAILTAHRHCEAEWSAAANGIGPHAFGLARRGRIRINLPAEDAVRLAAGYEGAPRPGLPPGRRE